MANTSNSDAEAIIKSRLNADKFYDYHRAMGEGGLKAGKTFATFGLVFMLAGAGMFTWSAHFQPKERVMVLDRDRETGNIIPRAAMAPAEYRDFIAYAEVKTFIEKLRGVQPNTVAQLANPKFNQNIINIKAATALCSPQALRVINERMKLGEQGSAENPLTKAKAGLTVRVEVLRLFKRKAEAQPDTSLFEIDWRETVLNEAGNVVASGQFKGQAVVLFRDPKQDGDYGVVIDTFDWAVQPTPQVETIQGVVPGTSSAVPALTAQ